MRSRTPLLLAAGALAFGVTLVLVQLSPEVRAGPPPPVTLIEMDELRAAGLAVTLTRRTVAGVPLVEPRPSGRAPRLRPLAAAPDGLTMAVSTVEPGVIGPLTLARADGSQLEVELPGLRGAAFEPGGTWLAVVDLAGAVWRVDAASGTAVRLAEGPYGPDPSVLPDGRILLVRVSAVDAPIWATAETVDADNVHAPLTGSLGPEEQLVYGVTPLADGSVALVRHRIGGGVAVVRLDESGAETQLTELHGAAAVSVSVDGRWLAWQEAGATWLAAANAVGEARAIGTGEPVRFSPDATLLLILGAEATDIVDLAGERIDQAGPGACWLGGGRGCRP